MNFFKSILADDDDLDSPKSEIIHESGGNSLTTAPGGDGNSDGWSFGHLIKTLSVQSESMIETYRRDLKEFGLGLRKESEIFQETANRAVKDLPASLEATASAAHGALDGVLKSTADIIPKDLSLFGPDRESETPEINRCFTPGRYSWFEAQLSALQNDLNTFCDEPENVEEYGKWKSGFELEDYDDQVDYLLAENGTLKGVYKRIVPNEVDGETFWCRYFYRVDKLKQQERVRANLMHRTVDDDAADDDLTWDFDDEEDGNGSELVSNDKVKVGHEIRGLITGENPEDLNGGSVDVKGGGDDNVNGSEKRAVVGDFSPLVQKEEEEEAMGGKSGEKVKSEKESVKEMSDEKVRVEDIGELGEGNDGSVLEEDEDMEWDEIGDTGSDDGRKASGDAAVDGGDGVKAALQKRLSAMEDDDEDLSWDIEDDDEPVKA